MPSFELEENAIGDFDFELEFDLEPDWVLFCGGGGIGPNGNGGRIFSSSWFWTCFLDLNVSEAVVIK